MTNVKDYPLFIPPSEVHSKKPREWNSIEAKIYFDWFMSVKDDRVDYLLTVFDEVFTGNIEADLKRLGQDVYETLKKEPFSSEEPTGKTITNTGLAIATDMALLVSRMIINKHPKIKWGIVKKPKRDISYQLPALFEFGERGPVELVRVSIVNARAILRGEERSDIWWRMFKYADDILKSVK